MNPNDSLCVYVFMKTKCLVPYVNQKEWWHISVAGVIDHIVADLIIHVQNKISNLVVGF